MILPQQNKAQQNCRNIYGIYISELCHYVLFNFVRFYDKTSYAISKQPHDGT